MEGYSLGEPLGKEGLEDFIWDYINDDLWQFSGCAFSIISNMYRLQNGGRGIMEEWAEKNNIPTCTVNEKQGYIMDNSTGNIASLNKKPHFEVIK